MSDSSNSCALVSLQAWSDCSDRSEYSGRSDIFCKSDRSNISYSTDNTDYIVVTVATVVTKVTKRTQVLAVKVIIDRCDRCNKIYNSDSDRSVLTQI